MKRCFTFNNPDECKLVFNFLRKMTDWPIHIQLSNAIIVADNVYSTAIVEGIKYVRENNIACNWVDTNGNILPLSLAPLATITFKENCTISPYCINTYCLSSINHFANFCESFLKRKLFMQVTINGTVNFLIEQNLSVDEHLEVAKSIQEHEYYLNDNIYDTIIFTDFFGNNISTY